LRKRRRNSPRSSHDIRERRLVNAARNDELGERIEKRSNRVFADDRAREQRRYVTCICRAPAGEENDRGKKRYDDARSQ
jgi:hypothetical protein